MTKILAILLALTCTIADAADETRYVGTTCEVTVNIVPLVDDTDQTALETAVAHDADGLELYWIFATPGGVVTATQVTPSASGDYKWTHEGLAIYSVVLPAEGGTSVNNDRIGTGRFVGKADGVFVWRGPSVEFVKGQ